MRVLIPVTAALGAAAVGYATVIERNWFVLRRCDVPVLATPVGIHAQALDDVAGTLCAPFELGRWGAALAPHLAAEDPRVAGRAHAERFSARRMAERVAAAWRSLVADAG